MPRRAVNSNCPEDIHVNRNKIYPNPSLPVWALTLYVLRTNAREMQHVSIDMQDLTVYPCNQPEKGRKSSHFFRKKE
jgi:hypothetical protein